MQQKVEIVPAGGRPASRGPKVKIVHPDGREEAVDPDVVDGTTAPSLQGDVARLTARIDGLEAELRAIKADLEPLSEPPPPKRKRTPRKKVTRKPRNG